MSQELELTSAELYYAMHVAPHSVGHETRQALEQHIREQHPGLNGFDYVHELNKHMYAVAVGRLRLTLESSP